MFFHIQLKTLNLHFLHLLKANFGDRSQVMNIETYKIILKNASKKLLTLKDESLDIVDVKKPSTIDYAIQLSKVISKLSPLIGNMIEFSTVDLLNRQSYQDLGKWVRQDPGFPDALFKSDIIKPNPGIEIKAWFPFATEITARFKDSVKIFEPDHINVALIAWLPEFVIFGKPKIIDVLVISGKSVAEARDKHYHKPPKYLVIEPEDTTSRTGNLQQTNTNGYKLQEEMSDIKEAQKIVQEWGEELLVYSPEKDYQERIKTLQAQFTYRLDTNYAKIDRIEHMDVEKFKTSVLNTIYHGKTIRDWSLLFSSRKKSDVLKSELESLLSQS